MSLNDDAKSAVMTYNNKKAVEVAKKAVAENADIVELIEKGFSAGMTEVGALFEAKKVYLPHVMAAAAAMNAAMDVLNPELEKRGAEVSSGLGTVVICTIEGDIHSIGKDIVAIMLKVAGFKVENIGRDVPLDQIVDACKKYKPVAVGTSALMTSTMVHQKTFEEKLKAAGIRDSLLTNVGGAPVTQQWADEIGADLYTENASDAAAKFSAAFEKQ
ncbi:MAG: methyltransferase cognate corrinoid protein [Candidatus Methanomethylophilaceae archaeon]|jgi:trimethylamine corrinoid protein|nr:methyltransferase cognate corrinoid protein [Candidatus Methanomethylophilaceae archaeon]MBR3476926.1 methyltransferase cognate corrinoid protein [Candidatus Methanomethylophilaceae archaeon]MBR6870635.1 methyltransferase cognate corrinoid protein [Candidatus Methanomethylophilaceae archaeon]